MTPLMATNLVVTSHLYPLFLPLAAHPLKISGIIIWRHRHADSARRREHPQDLVSTSLWPSIDRLSSTPQPLGNRDISLIDSSGRTQVSGVEGNYEGAAVFTGRYQPPPGPGLPLFPRGGKICQHCTTRSSGCGSPVDCYILGFLRHSSSKISATALLDRFFLSELLS